MLKFLEYRGKGISWSTGATGVPGVLRQLEFLEQLEH
jgi:hypothetical protein